MRRLGMGVSIGIVVAACSSAATGVDPRVAAAGRRAMEAMQTAIVEPAGAPCPPDAATWAAVQQQAHDRISAAFAEPERSNLLRILLSEGNSRACDLAAGVDDWEPSSTTVGPETAVLKARVGIWSRFRAANQPGIPEPHNLEDCTLNLVAHGSDWLVTSMNCTFVPGHGP